MAEENLTREYVIPLRRDWRKVANYRRAGRAAKEIKRFIARHMKVPDRDLSKVKIDIYLNNEIWFRGKSKPPAKIKVRAIKEKDIVRVELAEMPENLKFVKQRVERRFKEAEKKEEKPAEKPKEEKKEEKKSEEKSEEKKETESEKEKSVADVKAAEVKQDIKAAKHTTKAKGESYHRMALQK